MNGRFAPSPTGFMHLGNLAAALMSWLDARACGFGWLVRLEDVDAQRCKPQFAEAVLEDLLWLGLEPDEPPVRQSGRGEFYEAALRKLEGLGLTYRCCCTRAQILSVSAPQDDEEANSVISHRKICVPRQGTPASIRLLAPDETDSFEDARFGLQTARICDAAGDVVLRRADGLWGYQLASTVDDALQNIGIVTRGADLIPSAHVQRFLLRALGFEPPEYAHIPLVMAGGSRMAKRNGAEATLRYFRHEQNLLPRQVLALVARQMDLVPQDTDSVSLEELLRARRQASS